MGLIKTALIGAGGLYALNKLTKASEESAARRKEERQQQGGAYAGYSQQNPYYTQGYQGPHGQQLNSHYPRDNAYGGRQQQGLWAPPDSFNPANQPPPYHHNPPPYNQQQGYPQVKN